MNQKLLTIRRKRGWSQEETAEAIGVAKRTYQRWEHGTTMPNFASRRMLRKTFEATDRELGIEVEVLFDMPTEQAEVCLPPAPDSPDTRRSQIIVQNLPKPSSASSLNPFSPIQEERRLQLPQKEIQPSPTFNTLTIELSYPRWVDAMEMFWSLYFTGGIPVIEACLVGLLQELVVASNEASRLQKHIMALTSQAYQMYWLLCLQRQDFGSALLAIEQALTYSQGAQDANLELACLIRKAHLYFHLKNPIKQLLIHNQALQSLKSVSPLMRSWYYLLLAENHASLRHQKEAATFLDFARKTLPDSPSQDEAFSYVRMNDYLISNFEMISQLHLRQPRKVLDTLEYLRLAETDPRCSELLNHQLQALYLLNDMDEIHRQFPLAIKVANGTKSILRSHEICALYCKMIDHWPREQKIRELEVLLYT